MTMTIMITSYKVKIKPVHPWIITTRKLVVSIAGKITKKIGSFEFTVCLENQPPPAQGHAGTNPIQSFGSDDPRMQGHSQLFMITRATRVFDCGLAVL